MKKLLIPAALAALGALTLTDAAAGHGGTYRGPGDTVPPAGGGAGGGAGTPGTGGPTTPGGGSGGPLSPVPPGAPGGGVGAGGSGPTSSGGGDGGGDDLTQWQFWWGFNKGPYLNLKAHIHSGRPVTGSEEFYLGFGEELQGLDRMRPSAQKIRDVVVPALVGALRTESSNDIVTGALVALAKIGETEGEDGRSPTTDEILRFLSSSNQEIAETAAVALGILANDSERNLGVLTALLEDDAERLRRGHDVQILGAVPDRTRSFAAYGLGLIGGRAGDPQRAQIARTLVRRLEDPGTLSGTRDLAVACFTALGLVPLPVDPTAPALGELTEPEVVLTRQQQIAWLMAQYEDETWNHLVRAHVPTAVARLLESPKAELASVRTVVARRLLADMSRHSKVSREIKQSVTLALGEIGDCDDDALDVEIRAALMAVPEENKDQLARRFALIALAHAAGTPGDHGDPLAGLAGRKGARAYLLQKLARSTVQLRPWAALALGVQERSLADHGVETSLDVSRALRERLAEARAPDEVGALSVALGILSDPEATPGMLTKLEATSDYDAKGYVCVGLGLIGDGAAVAPIQELVAASKYRPALLRSASIGLGLLGDKNVVDELVAMLAQASGLSSQASIASALGIIGDSRSVDPLIGMLEDREKTALARGFAAAALGIVGDKESLPWSTRISIGINYRANTETLTSPSQGTGILDFL
jgi:HEAT repeat protein